MLKKMKNKIIISFIVLALFFVVLPISVTVVAHNYYFGNRIEHSNSYYDYLYNLDNTFVKEETSFKSNNGQNLAASFYSSSDFVDYKGLIVWVHGMGVNHENYLSEIHSLTNVGYVVFSYDNTGVNKSEGDSLIGLSQSVIDLHHASIYLNSLNKYNDIKNILIGHSWGGYAVTSVSSLDLPRSYDAIISLAGFNRNINVINDILENHIGVFTKLLIPYLNIYEQFIFGDASNLNGIDGLKSSNGEVLIIHSADDDVVLFENNYEVFKEEFYEDDRFTFIEYENAGHKLTINYESYIRIHDIMHHQVKLDPNSEHYIELENERLSLITDFNNDVMKNIIEFCNSIQ